MFRQGTLAHVRTTVTPNYPGAYTESSPVATFSNQSRLSQRGMLSKGSSESVPIGSGFLALLYSVYFAAMTAIQHSPNAPDVGSNVNSANLCSTFKKEVSTRIGLLQGNYVQAESIEMLQAMVVHMVRLSVGVCPKPADMHARPLKLARPIPSRSGCN